MNKTEYKYKESTNYLEQIIHVYNANLISK